MALSGTHITRPTSNSVAALFVHPETIRTRPPWVTPLRVLFCGNRKAYSTSAFCTTNSNGFSIDAKFLFNIRPNPSQNNRPSALERALKEIRETRWEVNSHGPQFCVAYQGVPGAYSEEAAMAAHPGCLALPCSDYKTAIQSVKRHDADRAILPVESTVVGTIYPSYDLLLRHNRLHVVGEIYLPVQYCLLVLPGVARAEIERIISHPWAVAQCERTLVNLGFGDASRQTTDDTAVAAEYISRNNLRHAAAIASARAAKIYGLRAVAREIQDDYCNFIRYVILAREPVAPAADRPQKTSIMIGHDGSLVDISYKILSAFSFHGVYLSKLECRPMRARKSMMEYLQRGEGGLNVMQFEHLYYVDFEASMADRRAQNALTELQKFTTLVRVLGSYAAHPKDNKI